MLRKSLTVVAVMAAIGAGSVGVANAATPVVKANPTCTTTGGVVSCLPGVGSLGHPFNPGSLGSHLPGGGLGGIFGGGILGGNTFINNNNHFRGGNFGGSFRGIDRFRGTFWNRGGVILPYSQVVSSCGCSGDPVSLGYSEVLNPQQVLVVPVGAVATGDGSCETLSSVNFGQDRFRRGVRFFRR